MKKKLAAAAGAVAAVFVVLGLLGAGDIIDLPGWANIPGIDLPVIGDTDRIDCKLSTSDDDIAEGMTEAELIDAALFPVEIKIVDGDASTYPEYKYIFNNGNLLEEPSIDRVADDLVRVIPNNDAEEQFFSISFAPNRDDRVFCESIVLN